MISLVNEFTRRLGLKLPIVQAPMAGASTPELAAAVSNAGALGSFAAAMLEPDDLREKLARIRALTHRAFNVNLFVLAPPTPSAAELQRGLELLRPFLAQLGAPAPEPPTRYAPDFRAQFEALIESAPPVASFTFGLLDEASVLRLQRAGSIVIGTATTVAEALAWERAGADFVCAQGIEAGGHRGTFLGDFAQSGIGLMALLPQMTAAVRCPVIAAGGIMNGRGIAAALLLGASAAQLGTAFLTCPETGIPAEWRLRLHAARDDGTRLTRLYTGRWMRVLVNRFIDEARAHEDEVPPYPVQRALTAQLRAAAERRGAAEFLPFLAGQAASLSRELPAAVLIEELGRELRTISGPAPDAG